MPKKRRLCTYFCTMPVLDPGGPGGMCPPPPPEEAVSVLNKFVHYMILLVYTAMVWGGLVEVCAVLGCFNGPHNGYANS